MKAQMIEGATRVCGKAQGFIGLPIRDETVDDPVFGPGTPQMVTSWEVFPDEVERIKAGAPVLLSILGKTPPPLLLDVGEAPDEREAREGKNQTDLHNAIAGRIVASIVRPVLAAGGDFPSMLVLLESVIVGIILVGVKLGSDERALDELMARSHDPFDCSLVVHGATKAALLCSETGDLNEQGKPKKPLWIPRSELTLSSDMELNLDRYEDGGRKGTIILAVTIPEWLAYDRGLM